MANASVKGALRISEELGLRWQRSGVRVATALRVQAMSHRSASTRLPG